MKVRLDTIKTSYKPLETSIIDNYKKSQEFNYSETQSGLTSFWDILLYKIRSLVENLFGNSLPKPIVSLLMIIFYLSVIILFVLLMLSLFGVNIQNIISINKNIRLKEEVNSEANLLYDNLDDMVKYEIDNGNFNLAVRYLYLKLLNIFVQKQLITWQRDKTNLDYMNDLANTPYLDEFKNITKNYEYLWYGKFQCSKSIFENIYSSFTNLFKVLNA